MKIRLAAELVLFEQPHSVSPSRERATESSAGSARSLLQIGFLLVDAYPLARDDGAEVSAPRLGDLLPFNEVFRYLASPNDHEYGKFTTHLGSNVSTMFKVEKNGLLGIWEWLLARPAHIDGGYRALVRPSDFAAARDALVLPSNSFVTGWLAHSDNRAFVWTCAVLDRAVEVEAPSASGREAAGTLESEAWVSLVNVDTPGFGFPTAFERKWVKKHTYQRWAEFGSFYGFCRHGGAMLQPDDDGIAYVPTVWRYQYLDQTLLLLYLRAVTFGISCELANLSHARWREPFQARDDQRAAAQQHLRDALVHVTNVYRYPLYSNQQQGEELFEVTRRALDVDRVFSEIDTQVAATEQLLRERWQSEVFDIAFVVQVMSLAVAGVALLFGTTELVKNFQNPAISQSWAWGLLGMIVVPSGLVAVTFRRQLGKLRSALANLYGRRLPPSTTDMLKLPSADSDHMTSPTRERVPSREKP